MQILIAEKNEETAVLYKQALENRNHKVTATLNGYDCLKEFHNAFHEMWYRKLSSASRLSSLSLSLRHKYKANQSAYDAVILDYKMPRVNGLEAAREILAVDPHQRIIFTSGSRTLKQPIKQLPQVVKLLQKPFAIRELVDTIEHKE